MLDVAGTPESGILSHDAATTVKTPAAVHEAAASMTAGSTAALGIAEPTAEMAVNNIPEGAAADLAFSLRGGRDV